MDTRIINAYQKMAREGKVGGLACFDCRILMYCREKDGHVWMRCAFCGGTLEIGQMVYEAIVERVSNEHSG